MVRNTLYVYKPRLASDPVSHADVSAEEVYRLDRGRENRRANALDKAFSSSPSKSNWLTCDAARSGCLSIIRNFHFESSIRLPTKTGQFANGKFEAGLV
jgi:hypothetical protein